MDFKVIIFDFDGVILESLDVKTRAFLKVYEDYPQHLSSIASYHLQNGGISRYKKFEYINTKILGIPYSELKGEKRGDIFSEAVVDEMLKCSLVANAIDFLSRYLEKVKMYVASGTPQKELQHIVHARKLDKYFEGVYGSPATKVELIQHILEKENISAKDAVFVGDALTDYESAKVTGVPFIARINPQIPDNPLSEMNLVSFEEFKQLDEILKGGC